MELIHQAIAFLTKLLDWYVIVSPWEQAIFVRHGNKVKLIKAGIYFKIPFLDTVYVQTVRQRTVSMPFQTITTQDGHAVTIKMLFAYSIADMMKLYNTLYHPETTLQGAAMSSAAEYISSKPLNECNIPNIESYVNTHVRIPDCGINGTSIRVVSFLNVKTYRLIQDNSYIDENMRLDHK